MSLSGRKLRINVSVQLNEPGSVGKFLVVVDAEASLSSLVEKIQRTLVRNNVSGTVLRVRNSIGAALPIDEALVDMLADGEDVHVEMVGDDGELAGAPKITAQEQFSQRTGSSSTMRPSMPVARGGSTGMRVSTHIEGPLEQLVPDDSGRTNVVLSRPVADPKNCVGGADHGGVPGPSEVMETEMFARDHLFQDQPPNPTVFDTYDNDWLAESLTPRLKDYVFARFNEAHIAEPKYVKSIKKYVASRFFQTSGSFVSIFLRPQTRFGSDAATTMPVHYNIPKSQLGEFRRLAERTIQHFEQRLQLLQRTEIALRNVLQKGMSEQDTINVMLPYSYSTWEEIEGLMIESENPVLGTIRGSRPVLIIDTAASSSKNLSYLRAVVKKALRNTLVTKHSFNIISFFGARGAERGFASTLISPAQQALLDAEEWLDQLVVVPKTHLLDGLRLALADPHVDSIYVLSSGESLRAGDDVTLPARNLQSINVRMVPIHCVGIDCSGPAELALRHVAEANRGTFGIKRFTAAQSSVCAYDHNWTSWRTEAVNTAAKKIEEDFKAQKLTIGGQLTIVEVMISEEQQKLDTWLQEFECCERLLVTDEKLRETALERDSLREMQRSMAHSVSVRVGGGFAYGTQEMDLGLEPCFERKSAVPWTANAETMAVGPHFNPLNVQGDVRAQRFPPSSAEVDADILPRNPRVKTEHRQPPRQVAVDTPWQPTGPPARTAMRGGYQNKPQPVKMKRNHSAEIGGARKRAQSARGTRRKPVRREAPAAPQESRSSRRPAAQAAPPKLERRWSF